MKINGEKRTWLFRGFSWKQFRFIQLFLFIIMVMLLSPVLQWAPLLTALLSLFFLNILLVSLSFAGFEVRRRWPMILLWLAGTVMHSASLRNPAGNLAKTLDAASEIVFSALIIACVAMILRYVLTSDVVTVDTIFGAIVAYFLIAFAFSSIYQALSVVEPGSFSIPINAELAGRNTRNMEFGYFSFVTIATLGYGDIVPRLPAARVLATMEAAIGQFYMAVIVAWLVSAHAGHRSEGSK